MTYQLIDDGNVLMKNNMPCKIIGIGSIKIRIHNGIVRKLSNARHVPNLKKNSIVLGILTPTTISFQLKVEF